MNATNTCGTPIPEPPAVIRISERFIAEHGEQEAQKLVNRIAHGYARQLDYWRHEHIYKESPHA